MRRGTRAFRREVIVGGAKVFVDHGFQWDGARNVWLTRARASFVLGYGPRFRIRPRGLFERLLGWHPGRPSGDPCIDDFFVAHSPTAEEAESMWSALTTRARSILVRSFDDAQLVSDGCSVALWREGDFGREADAEPGAELVADVVRFQTELFDRLRHLPGAIWRPAAGAWDERKAPTVLLSVPERVIIKTAAGATGAVLAASATCGSIGGRYTVDFDDASSVLDGAARLGAPLASLENLAPHRLVADGSRVELIWRELDVDRERVLAGARWVGQLAATGHRAMYR